MESRSEVISERAAPKTTNARFSPWSNEPYSADTCKIRPLRKQATDKFQATAAAKNNYIITPPSKKGSLLRGISCSHMFGDVMT